MSYFPADHPLAPELEVAVHAVREAGLLCRTVQADLDPGAMAKKDRSPVTVADFGSQALVCRALGEAFPDDPVIGEEDSAELCAAENAAILARVTGFVRAHRPEADAAQVCSWIDRGSSKDHAVRYWTLDPIDGTKGFLRGDQYAVALALILDGELAAAVVGCPNLGPVVGGERGDGTLYTALRGAGAWSQPLAVAGETRPVRVSEQDDPGLIRFCESVEAAHSSHGDAARIAERLAIRAEPVRIDSQAKYGVVARGEAEAYLRLPRGRSYTEKIWDHAPGALVVQEAGGRVTDITGRDLDFSHGYQLANNRGVIVTNGRLHDAVLGAIADLGVGGD
jgi:3'(2'), 5'-bisphosphate nucleotidase